MFYVVSVNVLCCMFAERRAREARPAGGSEGAGRPLADAHLPRHRARHTGRHRCLLHAHTRLPGKTLK